MAGAPGINISGGGTTASILFQGEGGNPGYFSDDPTLSLIQVGWTIVDHPDLGTVTNVVYNNDNPEFPYYLIYISGPESFVYGTNYTFTGSTGITITGGLRIGV